MEERELVLAVVDLRGYSKWAATLDSMAIATFLDRYYRRCAETVKRHGGRVVKYMGDACLFVFDAEQAAAALSAVRELVRADTPHDGLSASARIHRATVAAGELGPDDDPRYDVLGAGVNELFLLGGGPGIRISQPLYDALPDDARADFDEQRRPTVYTSH